MLLLPYRCSVWNVRNISVVFFFCFALHSLLTRTYVFRTPVLIQSTSVSLASAMRFPVNHTGNFITLLFLAAETISKLPIIIALCVLLFINSTSCVLFFHFHLIRLQQHTFSFLHFNIEMDNCRQKKALIWYKSIYYSCTY